MEDIQAVRKMRGYSQLAVARGCEMRPGTLSAYETGKRKWPWEELERVRKFLRLPSQQPPPPLLDLKGHHRIVPRDLRVYVDPGITWADIDLKYEDLYRQLKPQRTPGLAFRSLVRTDICTEALHWAQLFEDGAEATAACPGLLNFPYHPLVDCNGYPLGTQYRAAFLGTAGEYRWLLFPQLTLMLPDRYHRPDGLVLRYGPDVRWGGVQLDGGAHQNSAWDQKLDSMIKVPTLRFPSRHALGLNFAAVFREAVLSL
jgi:transcriptional regulator with XRE-family HTH domain